jgi:hypothetical protein
MYQICTEKAVAQSEGRPASLLCGEALLLLLVVQLATSAKISRTIVQLQEEGDGA